jgi:hypothetical protein
MPIDPHKAIAALVRAEAARTVPLVAPVPAPPPAAPTSPATEQCPPAGPAVLRWVRRRATSA